MRSLLILLLILPSLCFGDAETTIGGKTAQAHIIQCNGSSFRPRAYLNFSGASCSDVGGKTVVNLLSGGGGSGFITESSDTVVVSSTDTLDFNSDFGVSENPSGTGNISLSNTGKPWSKSGSTVFLTSSSDSVGIGTNGNINGKLIILGNVGINSTNPQATFDVSQGTGVIAGTSFGGNGNYISSNDAAMYFGQPSLNAGSLRQCSINGTNNECLDYDYETNANTVSISSPTGVDNIRFPGIALLANQFLIGGVTSGGGVGSTWDVNSALVAFYKMEDNAATSNVIDQTGNFNGTSATLTNNQSSPGKLNNGFSFDGTSSDVITIGTGANQTGAFAVEFWMKTTTASNLIVLGNRSASGSNVGWQFIINASGHANLIAFQVDTGATVVNSYSVSSINTGSWIHVVGNYDGTNEKVYINGVLESTTAQTGDAGTGAGTWYIGQSPLNALYYQGNLDNLRLYNRSLSQDEITGLYALGVGTEGLTGSTGSTNGVATNIIGTTGTVTSNHGLNTLADLIVDGQIESHGTLYSDGYGYFAGSLGIGTYASLNRLAVAGSTVMGVGYSGVFAAPSNGLLVQGNVGIGTSAVSNQLYVNGGTRTSTLGINANASSGTIWDLTSAIISFYKLEDNTSNTNVVDTQGLNTGVASGNSSTFSTTGKINNGFSFASSRSVDLGSSSTLKPTGAFSVAFWMNSTDSTSHVVMGNRSSVSPNVGWQFLINASGHANVLDLQVDNGPTVVSAISTTAVNTGSWFFVTAVYNGATVQLYINGLQEGGNQSLTGDANTGSGDFFLAKSPLNPTLFYVGKVDNVQLFNRALTTDEITDLYNLTNGTDAINGTVGGSGVPFVITSTGATTGTTLQISDSGNNIKTTLLDNGNLGLGTFQPLAKLDANGTVKMTGFQLPTNASSGYILMTNGVGIGTWQPAPAGGGTECASASCNLNVATTLNSKNVCLADGTHCPVGGTNPWISGNVGIATTSRVGIGTTLNGNLLDVAGGVNIGTTYAGNQTAPTNGLGIQGNLGVGTWVTDGNTLEVIGNIGIGTASTGSALNIGQGQFKINNSGVMTITNTANSTTNQVTIAANNLTTASVLTITSTSGSLTAPEVSILESGTGNTAAALLLRNSSTTAGGKVFEADDITNDPSPFTIEVNTGNVGIGTTLGNGSLDIRNQGVTPLMINSTLTTNTGDYLILNSAGNMGIGTWIPNMKFVTNGAVGHQWGSPIPVISSCGTSPSVKGTDNDFTITIGSVAATGCIATFGGTYQDASCVVTSQSSLAAAPSFTASNTAVTISDVGSLVGDLIGVHCDFKN